MITVGSLCSGYGGLDLGLELALGPVEHAWHVEYDKHPSAILAHHWPEVPNYGDVKHTDWTAVEPVDWLTAGYPCQPFSLAGLRKGEDDPRHLWPGVRDAVGAVRPRNVLLENVAAHLRDGFLTVLSDLAALGYDTRWGVVRASDAGAPHGRARLFVVATDAASQSGSLRHGDDVRAGSRAHGRGQAAGRSAAPDAGRGPLTRPAPAWDGLRLAPERGPEPSADTSSHGRDEGRAEPARLERGSDAPERRGAAPADARMCGRREEDPRRRGVVRQGGLQALGPEGAGPHRPDNPPAPDTNSDGLQGVRGLVSLGRDSDGRDGQDTAWGDFEPAVRRWERVTNRPAPRPTEPGRNGERLSPRFVEWMMGLPAGWVTDVPGIPRNGQLKALGNGVVPQQAALALRLLGVTATEVAA